MKKNYTFICFIALLECLLANPLSPDVLDDIFQNQFLHSPYAGNRTPVDFVNFLTQELTLLQKQQKPKEATNVADTINEMIMNFYYFGKPEHFATQEEAMILLNAIDSAAIQKYQNDTKEIDLNEWFSGDQNTQDPDLQEHKSIVLLRTMTCIEALKQDRPKPVSVLFDDIKDGIRLKLEGVVISRLDSFDVTSPKRVVFMEKTPEYFDFWFLCLNPEDLQSFYSPSYIDDVNGQYMMKNKALSYVPFPVNTSLIKSEAIRLLAEKVKDIRLADAVFERGLTDEEIEATGGVSPYYNSDLRWKGWFQKLHEFGDIMTDDDLAFIGTSGIIRYYFGTHTRINANPDDRESTMIRQMLNSDRLSPRFVQEYFQKTRCYVTHAPFYLKAIQAFEQNPIAKTMAADFQRAKVMSEKHLNGYHSLAEEGTIRRELNKEESTRSKNTTLLQTMLFFYVEKVISTTFDFIRSHDIKSPFEYGDYYLALAQYDRAWDEEKMSAKIQTLVPEFLCHRNTSSLVVNGIPSSELYKKHLQTK